MIKRTGIINSVLVIFAIITVTLFVIGGCDNNNSGNGIGDDDMGGCENISGSSNGVIQSTDDESCSSMLEDGCYVGAISGVLDGNVETIFETREEFNVITTKFIETTGLTQVVDNNFDNLFGHVVVVFDSDGKAAAGLIQWLPDVSDGHYEGATGHMVLDIKVDTGNKTYTSTWSGELCLP